ncbi:MAG TPA: ASPIC/UnbV domain-containing protein, partial [Pirellulaceae bacterium]|nr:ASPIC/UnbV domain-containing protein [Pirellulaceae bacterium]
IIAWGAAFADFDLDADLDVVITAGHHLRFPREPQVVKQPTIVLENVVGLTHLDHRYNRIAFRGDPYLSLEHEGRGVAVGDLDDDGDVDIVISHLDGPLTVLRNETANGNYWLRVKLIGRRGTRDPVGAVVRTTIIGRERVAQVRSGGGYLSSHDRRLTLGAGQVPRVERVEVRWPGGAVQRFDDLPINQELVVIEP